MITSTDLSSKGIWEDIAQKERARRDATLVHLAPSLPAIAMPNSLRVISIPNNYLPAIDATITETPPEKLVKSLMSGELKSVAVIQAFLQRARIAQKLVRRVALSIRLVKVRMLK